MRTISRSSTRTSPTACPRRWSKRSPTAPRRRRGSRRRSSTIIRASSAASIARWCGRRNTPIWSGNSVRPRAGAPPVRVPRRSPQRPTACARSPRGARRRRAGGRRWRVTRPSWRLAIRNWRSARAATCGLCVTTSSCALPDRRASRSPIADATAPPTPRSISSKIIVRAPAASASATLSARMKRDSSPPLTRSW